MKIDILTLFPNMFDSVFNESMVKRGQEKGLLEITTHNLRDWANDKHKTAAPAMRDARRSGRVDDSPYGGGSGMVMKVDVIDRALANLKSKIVNRKSKIILLTPQGKTFTQRKARTLASYSNLILICGHYEGFDERVRYLVDEQISIGAYILTGGEIPAMVLVDAISRLIPGVLGKDQSHQIESFSMHSFIGKSKIENLKSKIPTLGWLEYPQYTRPEKYFPISKKYKKALLVPKVLLSGNHQRIHQWRVEKSICRNRHSFHMGSHLHHLS